MRRGIIFGAFDLLHAGHINLFKEARKYCDYLYVGVQVNPNQNRKDKNKPIESVLERQLKLISCRYVDKVYVYEDEKDIFLMLNALNIDVRFLGSDYAGNGKPITDEAAVPIKYILSLPIHTSDIRERIKNS